MNRIVFETFTFRKMNFHFDEKIQLQISCSAKIHQLQVFFATLGNKFARRSC
jgi:hypothetical protein